MRRRLSMINVLVIIAAIAVIGIVGYKYYMNDQQHKAATSVEITNVPVAPVVTTPTDLDTATTAMDETKLSTSNDDDLTQLEAELDNF